MSDQTSQDFLRELEKKRWTAADRLRSNLDAAVNSRAERGRYRLRGTRRVDAGASINHAVLGLIFLKYVSDSFAQRQAEIETILKDPESDFFMDPAD